MEYLFTYGWAIALITGVLAILFYMGAVTPPQPKGCMLQGGFACNAYKITGGGALTLDLVQSTGHELFIQQVACTANTTPAYENVNAKLSSGDRLLLNATCYKADGSKPQSQDPYSGTLYFRYLDETTNVNHTMMGTIEGTVE